MTESDTPRSLTIVVTDHTPEILAAARVLHDAGHTILEGATDADSLRLAQAERSDVVLLNALRPEKTLRESEALLNGVLNSAPSGIMAFKSCRNADGVIEDFTWQMVNAAAEQMVGRTQEDLLGKRLLDEMPGNRTAGLFDRYVQVVETGIPLRHEHYYEHERVKTWFNTTAVKLEDGFVVTFADITDRKRAEEAARETERRLSFAMETSHIGVWNLDILDHTCFHSLEHDRIFGYAELQPDWTYDTFLEHVLPEDRAQADGEFRKAIESGRDSSFECRIRRVDGEVRWIWSTGRLQSPTSGVARRMTGIVQDITERKNAEQQMRSLARFPTENPNPVLRVTTDGRLLYANPAAQPLLASWGIGLGDALPEQWRTVVSETDGAECPTKLDLIEGECVWRVSAMPIQEEAYVNLYVRDVTEARMVEAQLRQQQKLDSIGTLASGIAHEINNPINGIMNLAQLIEDELEPTNPAIDYSRRIVKETERITIIVRNLLAFARQERQSHSPARMEDVVTATLSLINTVLRHDQIQLTVTVPDDLPTLKCRSQQIQQVLMNLVTNARDALNAKDPDYYEDKVILIQVTAMEKDGRRWLRTTVEDHGCGIPHDLRPRLFDPFFTTKPRDLGTGLGLSISHGIVKEHHGELTFESEPGQWTRFYLDLPVDNGWEYAAE